MLMDEKIRFVMMPEMRTVSKYVIVRETPDDEIHVVKDFLHEQCLMGTARIFGCAKEPYATEETDSYGWVFYASIPNCIRVPDSLVECTLPGGLYAAMPAGDDVTESWKDFMEYINKRSMYTCDTYRTCLEEFTPGIGNAYNITLYVAVQEHEGSELDCETMN